LTPQANIESGATAPPAVGLVGASEQINDRELVDRIVRAYQRSIANDLDSRGSEWIAVPDEKKRPIHEAMMAGDIAVVQGLLRDPARTELFYGFDNLHAGLWVGPDSKTVFAVQVHELLVRLGQAIGVYRLPNTEIPLTTPNHPGLEDCVKMLDEALELRVEFPNPFPGELGAETSRGIISHRTVQALYQAWRISRLCAGIQMPRVVEIGAGLGRTAYYAWKMGLRDYTIIDIAMSAVAQSYFLGRVLGTDCIRLNGEEVGAGIRILPPSAFLESNDRYDLVLNVDSWTEMPRETARQYVRAAESRASMIWSVNHEANRFTVRDLFSAASLKRVVRSPYWVRDGYVDELIVSGSIHDLNSALPMPPRMGTQPIDRARRRLEQLKRRIARWNPINKLLSGRG
jgi:hypothetical protein